MSPVEENGPTLGEVIRRLSRIEDKVDRSTQAFVSKDVFDERWRSIERNITNLEEENKSRRAATRSLGIGLAIALGTQLVAFFFYVMRVAQ